MFPEGSNMGKRGPKKTPTHLALVRGARKDRINNQEPQPSEGDIVAPVGLSEAAAEVWDRLAPDLIAKEVLTPWDVDEFVGFCDAVARRDKARAKLDADGEVIEAAVFDHGKPTGTRIVLNPWWQVWKASNDAVMKYGARFGLSPSERSQIRTGGGPGGQGADDYFT